MALAAGTRLGPYEVTAPIGAGGMDSPRRVRDTKLNRDVALKVLPEAFVADPERLARFQREAEVLASLNHPNIAHIYGLEDGGETMALVLELVEGPTLADRIASGAIPLDEALSIAKQIAGALEVAHEQGIIHRDLKPANIKVTREGVVKVLDFGLAKALTGGESADSNLSQSPTLTKDTALGVIMGTAAYMSPEQAKGKPVDRRTDVWAFGAVFYEMLAGKRAFEGEDVSDTLVSVFRDDPDWTAVPDEVPSRVLQAIRVCLRKDRNERVRDVAAVRLAMEGAFETEAPPRSKGTTITESRLSQRPLPLALAGLAVFLAGGLVVRWLTPEVERPVGRFVVSTSPDAPFIGGASLRELTISPDGRHIVYVAGAEGELYVRSIDEIDATASLGGVVSTGNPFFSPDGAWVGFATSSDTSWRKVSILGGPPTTLWDAPSAPRGASWGPDKTIVFGHGAPDSGLFIGSEAGGPPEVLTTPDATLGERNHWWPEFLPGGRAVLFTIIKGSSDQEREIAVLDLETNSYEILIPGGSHPSYAATGHLVYGTEGTLFAVRFDLARLQVTGNPVPVVTDVMNQAVGPANFVFSSNGSLVYASGRPSSQSRSLTWVDRDGNREPLAAEPGDYRDFRLSPDGRRVVLRVGSNGSLDLWLYDLERGSRARLTFDPAFETSPLWTPDGARVAFGYNAGRLSWKASDGTGETEQLGERGQLPRTFTPDGKTVIFEQETETGDDIGMLSLDGKRTSKILLDTESDEKFPALSPDGRWLAYQSNESGRNEVYVRPFPEVDTGRWQVSSNGGQSPAWSPLGNELFYCGPSAVMGLTFDTDPTFTPHTPNALFAWDFPPIVYRRIEVSSDAKRFLMLESVRTETDHASASRIIFVENWFEELKRLVPAN